MKTHEAENVVSWEETQRVGFYPSGKRFDAVVFTLTLESGRVLEQVTTEEYAWMWRADLSRPNVRVETHVEPILGIVLAVVRGGVGSAETRN